MFSPSVTKARVIAFLASEPLGRYTGNTVCLFLLIAIVPFILGLIGVWSEGLGFILFVFVGIPTAFGMPIVTCFKLWGGIRVAKYGQNFGQQALAVILAPGLLALWLVTALPLFWAGMYLGDLSRLAVNESHYRDIVNMARISKKAEWYAEHEGVTYSIDVGPPIRVAFNPAGFLDNWSAIVFDPSGDVMLADGFHPKTGKFYAPDRVTKLFSGDLVECRPLWGDYYKCSFT